ncbi:MAG: ParB N-terminal domain-containing protein, partial [Romboutsia sp.]|nr:ParB N-terminal domain-containing protein [Romboutsia sp.]
MSFKLTSEMKNGLLKNTNKTNLLKSLEFETRKINLSDIQRSEKNFYDLNNIDDLAEDIKLNGLYHNILVRELENSTYEIISGERRFLAYNKLFNEGDKNYSNIPCKVIKVNDEDAEIILIEANATTRELSDKEKLLQVEKLTTLYNTKKANGGKIPGRIQKHISKSLGMSETSVARLQKISKNLIPELKEKFNNADLSLSNANEFASLDEEQQKIVKEILDSDIVLSKEEAQELKSKLNEIKDNSNENNTSSISSSEAVNSIKKEFTEPKDNISPIKELDLKDKIKKINNSIVKLTKDLDKKDIAKLKEGILLLNDFKENIENLLSKIKENEKEEEK